MTTNVPIRPSIAQAIHLLDAAVVTVPAEAWHSIGGAFTCAEANGVAALLVAAGSDRCAAAFVVGHCEADEHGDDATHLAIGHDLEVAAMNGNVGTDSDDPWTDALNRLMRDVTDNHTEDDFDSLRPFLDGDDDEEG